MTDDYFRDKFKKVPSFSKQNKIIMTVLYIISIYGPVILNV